MLWVYDFTVSHVCSSVSNGIVVAYILCFNHLITDCYRTVVKLKVTQLIKKQQSGWDIQKSRALDLVLDQSF